MVKTKKELEALKEKYKRSFKASKKNIEDFLEYKDVKLTT